MSPALITALIAGVVGLATGLIGSLVAPWVNWGIEVRRNQHNRRVELIDKWREILGRSDFSRSDLLDNPLYGAIRPLLSQAVLEEIERPANNLTIVLNSAKSSRDRDLLLMEVARIEKLWKLV